MKIHEVQQGTDSWLMLRAGVVTASEADTLVSPEGKIRTGQGVETYLYEKAYERVMGYPEKTFAGGFAEQGLVQETRAIPFYEAVYGDAVRRVGFITTFGGKAGCSPDGLIGEDGGIEIKSPSGPVHVRYLLEQRVPKDYVMQVQMSLWVTGRKWWVFMSYHPSFPPLVVKVLPDQAIQRAIGDALAAFLPRLDAAESALRGMMPQQGGRA